MGWYGLQRHFYLLGSHGKIWTWVCTYLVFLCCLICLFLYFGGLVGFLCNLWFWLLTMVVHTLLGFACKGSRSYKQSFKSWFACFKHCHGWKMAGWCPEGKCPSRSSKSVVVDSWNTRPLFPIRVCQAPPSGCCRYDWFTCSSRVLENRNQRLFEVSASVCLCVSVCMCVLVCAWPCVFLDVALILLLLVAISILICFVTYWSKIRKVVFYSECTGPSMLLVYINWVKLRLWRPYLWYICP